MTNWFTINFGDHDRPEYEYRWTVSADSPEAAIDLWKARYAQLERHLYIIQITLLQ